MQVRIFLKLVTLYLGITSVQSFRRNIDNLFQLNVVHFNDFHARFLEINDAGGNCKNTSQCIGGFSRLFKQITTILDERPDTVLLNAGDNFQGTLYYTVGRWNITQEFLNKLPFDASVLGNHEFDDGLDGVIPFVKALNHPVVVSNIDDRLEPRFQGIYSKSTVIVRNGKKIGVIGALIAKTNEISITEKLKFYPESASVNAEAERLVKEEGVYTNIVLSHCGYDIDHVIAKNASEKIGLIVGAHSHSFLYTGESSPGPDKAEGPYPTIIKSKYGKNVLIVQASCFGKYLGNISVFYDEMGEVVDFSGAPIFLETSLPKDPNIDQALLPWKEKVDSQGEKIIGSTYVKLDRKKRRTAECTLGNFVTDAMVYAYLDMAEDAWTYASVAIFNAGGLRTDIEVGDITYGDMATAQPFENTFDVAEIEGKYLKELLELSTESHYNYGREYVSLNLNHFSGIRVVMDLKKPKGHRILTAKIRCQACQVPIYEDLDVKKTYRIILPSFLVQGGDGLTVISENIRNVSVGRVDMDVYVDYFAHKSPLFVEEEGRITILGRNNIVTRRLEPAPGGKAHIFPEQRIYFLPKKSPKKIVVFMSMCAISLSVLIVDNSNLIRKEILN